MVGDSPTALAPLLGGSAAPNGAAKLNDELKRWLGSDADKTFGGLFEGRSFAGLFPLPTAGVALEILVGWAAFEALGGLL